MEVGSQRDNRDGKWEMGDGKGVYRVGDAKGGKVMYVLRKTSFETFAVKILSVLISACAFDMTPELQSSASQPGVRVTLGVRKHTAGGTWTWRIVTLG